MKIKDMQIRENMKLISNEQVKFWNNLKAIKETAIICAQDLSDNEAALFYGELACWATGMATPKHLRGSERTEAIRAFFRGMKRRK